VKQYYLQRNPGNLHVLLGKLFVFAFTWSFGAVLRRIDDMEDDGGIRSRDPENDEPDVDIGQDFDNLVREIFDTSPPLGSDKLLYKYTIMQHC
jgi:hypothetical protein